MAEVESCLRVGEKFQIFDEFQRRLREYKLQTKQIYCIASSQSVDAYNKKHQKKLNERLEYAYIKYSCKCGGRQRHRGTEEWKLQRYQCVM